MSTAFLTAWLQWLRAEACCCACYEERLQCTLLLRGTVGRADRTPSPAVLPLCQVGCHSIKQWYAGAGIATSLKILFSSDDCTGQLPPVMQLSFERNEVIALINLLERLSKSIEIVRVLSAQLLGGSSPSLGSIQEVTNTSLQSSMQQ